MGGNVNSMSTIPKTLKPKNRKSFWTKQFYIWHWVSSAVCLVAMLLFAITGITLNHSAELDGKPKITTEFLTLPAPMLASISGADPDDPTSPLPLKTASWLTEKLSTPLKDKPAEWSEEEIYISLPRPGGDAWLAIDRRTGETTYELTLRGTIPYLNDLHKGRHTGTAWSWFIDIFSAACIIFCLTGLCLLRVHARRRPSTWPVVIAGIAIPVILVVFFIH